MTHPSLRALVAIVVATGAASACAIAETEEDAEDVRDVRTDVVDCDPGACLRTCMSLGSSGGRCVDGTCSCESLDGPVDFGPDDAGEDAPPSVCDPATCDSACRSIGSPGGTCVGDECRCGSGPDADADGDADPPDDAAPDEAPPPDDGGPDEAAGDDAPVDEAAVDDARPDEATAEDAGSEDSGGVWGVPVCNTTGGTLRDRGMFGGATTYSQTVALPSLGLGRAVRLEISITPRRFLVATIPFSDIQATLASPDGTTRKFWYHFEGDTAGMLGDYTFFTPWILPVWWDRSVGGTWTLTLRDDEFSGVSTTLASWCLTPIDPATHASTDTAAHLSSCDSSSTGISDYACDADGAYCEHPETIQHQVTELIRASGAPTIALDLTHGDPSQLVIELIGADGSETVLWNRSAGPLPASFPLSLMSGAWMTGRYQLTITDMVAGTSGTLRRWCIEAN